MKRLLSSLALSALFLALSNQGAHAASLLPPKHAREARSVSSGTLMDAQIKARVELPSKPAIRYGGQYGPGSFGWGQCVQLAAIRRHGLAFLGNANQFTNNAKAAGYKTGKIPVVDALVQTTEGWVGHIAIVDKVYADGSFKISEYNYQGVGVLSTRVLHPNDKRIVGFIY